MILFMLIQTKRIIKFPFKRNGLPCFENAKTFPLEGAQRTASVCEL